MPDSCCVPLCFKSDYRVGPDGKRITYHCLPSDAVRLKVLLSKLSFIKPIVSDFWYFSIRHIFQEWLVKIRRDVSPAFQITERTKICSLNFKITDFRVTLTGRRYLKDDAIPSIFSWSAASPKRKSPRKRSPSHSIAHDQKPSCKVMWIKSASYVRTLLNLNKKRICSNFSINIFRKLLMNFSQTSLE